MWEIEKKSVQLDIANGLYFYKNNNKCNRNYIQGNIKLKTSVEILFRIIQTSDKLYPRIAASKSFPWFYLSTLTHNSNGNGNKDDRYMSQPKLPHSWSSRSGR